MILFSRLGWQGPENLAVPDGIHHVFQPAHSPELQPAEHLWVFVDEPLANRCFETIENLDQAVGNRCVTLTQQPNACDARPGSYFGCSPCAVKAYIQEAPCRIRHRHSSAKRSLFGIIDQKEEFGFVLPKSGLIRIIFLSPGANFPARILSFLLCFSVYAVACRRTASNARIANLRRDSARRS